MGIRLGRRYIRTYKTSIFNDFPLITFGFLDKKYSKKLRIFNLGIPFPVVIVVISFKFSTLMCKIFSNFVGFKGTFVAKTVVKILNST